MAVEMLHIDCMDYMQTLPDKAFDLAIVDPPYGLNMAKERPRKDGRFAHNKPRKWDENIPSPEYFSELMRISNNQIIWGGNYFGLPPTQGFIFWYKQNPVENFSDGEYAWTSFRRPARCFDYRYYGNLEGKSSASDKIHISQKPVALYKWILHNYAKPGDRILDTHVERRLRGLKLDEREALLDGIDSGRCSGSSFRVDVVVVLPGMFEIASSSFLLVAALQSVMGLRVAFEVEEEAQLLLS